MNWIRLNDMSMELARPRASWVLPVPGLSSSRMCPPTTMAVAHWRMGASLPTTTWETLSTSLANFSWNSVMSLLGAVIMDVSMTGWDCLTGCTGWLGWTGWVGWTGCCAGIATAGLAAGWRRFCGIG